MKIDVRSTGAQFLWKYCPVFASGIFRMRGFPLVTSTERKEV
ncbi:MAG: hypothetical protein ACETWT_03685 [Thermodesulfobacteriota bacterium]